MQNVELRRRVQIGLNKGEAKNAPARAVFLNRLGEIRDRSFENQLYRASGLNVVVAAFFKGRRRFQDSLFSNLNETVRYSQCCQGGECRLVFFLCRLPVEGWGR